MEGSVASKTNEIDRSVKIQLFQRMFPMVAFQFTANPISCYNDLLTMVHKKFPTSTFALHFLTRGDRLDEKIFNDGQLYHRCMAAAYLENRILNVRLVERIDSISEKVNFVPLGWSDSMNPSRIRCIEDWKRETEKIMIKSKDEMNEMVKNAIKEVKKEASKAKKEIKNECVSQILKLAPQDNQVSQFAHPAVCDICDNSIYGHRFKCTICDDYDLCKKCEAEGKHSQHALLRTVAPSVTITPDYIVKGFENISAAADNKRAEKKYEDKWEKLVQKSSLRPKTSEPTVVKDVRIERDIEIKAPADIFFNNGTQPLTSAEMMSKLRSAENVLKWWRNPGNSFQIGSALPVKTASSNAESVSKSDRTLICDLPVLISPPQNAVSKVEPQTESTRIEENNVATLKDRCLRTLEEKYASQKTENIETCPKVDEIDLVELTKTVENTSVSTTDEDDSSSSVYDDLESLTSVDSIEDFTDFEIELSRKALNLPVPDFRLIEILHENKDAAEEEGIHTAVAPTPDREDLLQTAIPLTTDEEEDLHTAVAPTPEPQQGDGEELSENYNSNIPESTRTPEQESDLNRRLTECANVINRHYSQDPLFQSMGRPHPRVQQWENEMAARRTYMNSMRNPAQINAVQNQVRAPVDRAQQGPTADATASALLEMGFSFSDIQTALTNAGINVENCVQFLLHKSF